MPPSMCEGARSFNSNDPAGSDLSRSSPCAPDYLRLTLASKVYDAIETTPLTRADGLSLTLQCNVLLKREDFHSVGSYKVRGVYNLIAHLPQQKQWKGVITCSRGNHALAVAFSARRLRIPSLIVLPLDTPPAVQQRLSRLRSTVVLHGSNLEDAREECFRLQELYGLVYIPVTDDAFVIAGHGTVGPEILKQADPSRLKAIVCPVACGALIAGLGMYVKRVAPCVKVIGVEHVENDTLARFIRHEENCQSDNRPRPSRIAEETLRICAEVVDDIVLVDDPAIARATREAFEDTQRILQLEGAMTIAGLKKWVFANEGLVGPAADIVAVASEANVDFFSIPSIIQQSATLGKAIISSDLSF